LRITNSLQKIVLSTKLLPLHLSSPFIANRCQPQSGVGVEVYALIKATEVMVIRG